MFSCSEFEDLTDLLRVKNLLQVCYEVDTLCILLKSNMLNEN